MPDAIIAICIISFLLAPIALAVALHHSFQMERAKHDCRHSKPERGAPPS